MAAYVLWMFFATLFCSGGTIICANRHRWGPAVVCGFFSLAWFCFFVFGLLHLE